MLSLSSNTTMEEELSNSTELWRELPAELWGEIGTRLETRLDILRFRSVCKSWRSNLPPPKLFPLRIPPPPTINPNSFDFGKYQYFITEETGYAIHGSSSSSSELESESESKVVVFEELYSQGRLKRFHPKSLYNDHDLTQFATKLNMDQLSITSLFKSHQLRWAVEKPPPAPAETPLQQYRRRIRQLHLRQTPLQQYRRRIIQLHLRRRLMQLRLQQMQQQPQQQMQQQPQQQMQQELQQMQQHLQQMQQQLQQIEEEQEQLELEGGKRFQWCSGKCPGIDKIVLISTWTNTSTPVPTGINPNYAISDSEAVDLSVVALLPGGQLSRLRLVSSDFSIQSTMEWKPIDCDHNSRFDDIVNYRGQLVGIDYYGETFVLDYKSMKMTRMAPSPVCTDCLGRTHVLDRYGRTTQMIASPLYDSFLHPDPNNWFTRSITALLHKIPTALVPKNKIFSSPLLGRKRLVEASGDLYLLISCRVPAQGVRSKIKVFQLRPQSSSSSQLLRHGGKPVWVEIKTLACNQAFFVKRNFAFSTLAAGDIFRNLGRNGNCIFLKGLSFSRAYSDDFDYPLFPEMILAPSAGVYNLEDDDNNDDSPNFRKIDSNNCSEIVYSAPPSFLHYKIPFDLAYELAYEDMF